MTTRASIAAAVLACVTSLAAPSSAKAATEHLQYSWQLRGGLAWIASLRFPTSGSGELLTTRTTSEPVPVVDTQLRITASEGSGFYLYQSQIDQRNGMTLMTYDGYRWGDKQKTSRTLFDYGKRLARTHEESPEKVKDRVRAIPHEQIRDVLTAIYYLRQNSATIAGPQNSSIYSNGKLYPVIFEPVGAERVNLQARAYDTRVFKISATPGTSKRWSGAVKVWLTSDAAAVPVRIEILRNYATLRLELKPPQ